MITVQLSLRPCRTNFFLAFTGQDTVHGGFTQVREFLGYLPNCLKHRGLHIP